MVDLSDKELVSAIERLDKETEDMGRKALGSTALRNFQLLMEEYRHRHGQGYVLSRLK